MSLKYNHRNGYHRNGGYHTLGGGFSPNNVYYWPRQTQLHVPTELPYRYNPTVSYNLPYNRPYQSRPYNRPYQSRPYNRPYQSRTSTRSSTRPNNNNKNIELTPNQMRKIRNLSPNNQQRFMNLWFDLVATKKKVKLDTKKSAQNQLNYLIIASRPQYT